jgi:HK97 family phage major capsid protein
VTVIAGARLTPRMILTLAFTLALVAVAWVIGHDAAALLFPLFLGPTLVERREELDTKRKSAAKLWEVAGDDLNLKKVIEAKLLDPKFDTTDKVASEMQRQQKEISDLAQMLEIAKGKEMLGEIEKHWNEPDGQISFAFPGGGKSKGKYAGKSLGDLVVESDTVKKYERGAKKGPTTEIALEDEREYDRIMGTKAVLTETGYPIQAVRTGLILPGALRRPVVADLIPQGTTRTNAIVYMEETTTTNAAAAVAESGAKPESTLVFTEQNSPVRKVATVLPLTDELITDEPAMRAYVEGRLRLFLQLAEESQLLTGTGTAPQLRGLYNIVGINTQAKGADPTPDAIYKGMDLIRTLAFLEPDSVVIHPTDWQDVRLLRTTDGIYIWGPPMDAGPQRIWGVPVVITPAATLNTALVLAAAQGMQIFRRSEVSFAISDQHADFFILNQLMLRVEERLALVVYRPKAICTITGI